MLQYQSLSERKKTLNCRGRLVNLEGGAVMGILNTTPDSFFDGGHFTDLDSQLKQVEKMLKEGAAFIDIGGYSSRPGADDISEGEELKRVIPAIESIVKNFPEALLSIDTFRSGVAKNALEAGVHIVNDISGGTGDKKMLATVATFNASYIIMHMQGSPKTMQMEPHYDDVAKEVIQFLDVKMKEATAAGITDVVLDPGFGFGKNLEQNFELLNKLHLLTMLGQPVMVGVSRKSMINKVLHTKPENALNGTTIVNTMAVLQGCDILRVHDVKEAVQVFKLVNTLKNSQQKI